MCSVLLMLHAILGSLCKIYFEKQVASIFKSLFYHIRNIARIRRFLAEESTKALVHALLLRTAK